MAGGILKAKEAPTHTSTLEPMGVETGAATAVVVTNGIVSNSVSVTVKCRRGFAAVLRCSWAANRPRAAELVARWAGCGPTFWPSGL
jgi:hypothetical protein